MIFDVEIIPGMRQTNKQKEFVRTKHGTKDEILAYKIVPLSPKLVSQDKVQSWRDKQVFALKSASLIGKSPIGDSLGPWPLQVCLDHPFSDHDFSTWFLDTRKLHRRASSSNQSQGRRPMSSVKPFFLDAG